jgi:hypothetical protein
LVFTAPVNSLDAVRQGRHDTGRVQRFLNRRAIEFGQASICIDQRRIGGFEQSLLSHGIGYRNAGQDREPLKYRLAFGWIGRQEGRRNGHVKAGLVYCQGLVIPIKYHPPWRINKQASDLIVLCLCLEILPARILQPVNPVEKQGQHDHNHAAK